MGNKKLVIVDSQNSSITDSIIKNFENKNVEIFKAKSFKDLTQENPDLIVLINTSSSFIFDNNANNNISCDVLNLHFSLLPAFTGENPIKQAFLAGVKVSGITIHKVENDNFYADIIAQCPVLIGLSTHYDEVESEFLELSKKIYPVVIESILSNKVFDFNDLVAGSNSCGGGCSSCRSSQH